MGWKRQFLLLENFTNLSSAFSWDWIGFWKEADKRRQFGRSHWIEHFTKLMETTNNLLLIQSLVSDSQMLRRQCCLLIQRPEKLTLLFQSLSLTYLYVLRTARSQRNEMCATRTIIICQDNWYVSCRYRKSHFCTKILHWEQCKKMFCQISNYFLVSTKICFEDKESVKLNLAVDYKILCFD